MHRVELIADALLFDLDGTLVDSTPAVIRSWTAWATERGITLPEGGPDDAPDAATVQAIATTAIALNDISIMFSTVRARTMPP